MPCHNSNMQLAHAYSPLHPPLPHLQTEVRKKAALLAEKRADALLSTEQLRAKYEAEHIRDRLKVRACVCMQKCRDHRTHRWMQLAW